MQDLAEEVQVAVGRDRLRAVPGHETAPLGQGSGPQPRVGVWPEHRFLLEKDAVQLWVALEEPDQQGTPAATNVGDHADAGTVQGFDQLWGHRLGLGAVPAVDAYAGLRVVLGEVGEQVLAEVCAEAALALCGCCRPAGPIASSPSPIR